MTIELHIDRLVLDGVAAPHQARAIRDAVHAELARLLTAAPASAWRDSARIRRIPAPDVHTGHSPTALGTSIARSVHSAVSTPPNGVAS